MVCHQQCGRDDGAHQKNHAVGIEQAGMGQPAVPRGREQRVQRGAIATPGWFGPQQLAQPCRPAGTCPRAALAACGIRGIRSMTVAVGAERTYHPYPNDMRHPNRQCY